MFTLTDRAGTLLTEALSEAYADRPVPTDIMDFLARPHKSGKVCAIFFSGRSGSYFAQSFFDDYTHPQVLTAHPVGLVSFDTTITHEFLADFNRDAAGSAGAVENWAETLLDCFPSMCSPAPDQPTWDRLCAPKALFRKFVVGQLLLVEPGKLDHEVLLKLLMIAYRLSRGGPLACDRPLAFLWQAHVPSATIKDWLRETFRSPVLLTVVRFPEKSLDSHLMHHAFETISPPFHTLFRRLFFEHMVANTQLSGPSGAANEFVIRFEDLHHHTADVLAAVCRLLEVPFTPDLCTSTFSMQARDRKVSGVRKLTREEFSCKILNFYDRLKVRYLLQEEYRAWGYDEYCDPSLETSMEICQRDVVAQTIPFAAQSVLAELDRDVEAWLSGDPAKIKQQVLNASHINFEVKTLRNAFARERDRREGGINVIPLLYSLEGLSVA